MGLCSSSMPLTFDDDKNTIVEAKDYGQLQNIPTLLSTSNNEKNATDASKNDGRLPKIPFTSNYANDAKDFDRLNESPTLPSSIDDKNTMTDGQLYDSQPCKCDQGNWKCIHIRHQSIPMNMIADIYDGKQEIGNFLTKHNCVRLQIRCNSCGHVFFITAEHDMDDDVQLRNGFYQKESGLEQDIDLPYGHVYAIFQLFQDQKYYLLNYNSWYFAKEFYFAIVKQNDAAF